MWSAETLERSALNWHICFLKGATEAKREVLEYRGSVVRLRQRWAQAAPSPGLVDDLELDQLSDTRWHQLVCISSQSFKAAAQLHILVRRWLLLLGSKTWPNHFRKSTKVATYPWKALDFSQTKEISQSRVCCWPGRGVAGGMIGI